MLEHHVFKRMSRTGWAAGGLGDAHGNDTLGHFHLLRGNPSQCDSHKFYPYRQGGSRTLLARSKRQIVIVADPDDANGLRIKPCKPGIAAIIRSAGLAGQITASEYPGTYAGATTNHIAHRILNQKRILRADDSFRLLDLGE